MPLRSMDMRHLLFGERSLTKVVSLYGNRDAAHAAALEVREHAQLDPAQVAILDPVNNTAPLPGTRHPAFTSRAAFSNRLEPESAGIARTLVRTHVVMGIAGLVLGGLVILGLWSSGIPAVVSSPVPALLAGLFVGALMGLMAGGFVSLRPDHLRVIAIARNALKRGCWAVVTHPLSSKQTGLVMQALRPHSDRVVRSF